jgi:hypothetical protein
MKAIALSASLGDALIAMSVRCDPALRSLPPINCPVGPLVGQANLGTEFLSDGLTQHHSFRRKHVSKRFLFPVAVAVLLAFTPALRAAARQQAGSSQPASPNNVHFEGCVFTETALTSTTAVVIPVGSTQSYILTNIKVIAGTVSADEAAKNIYAMTKVDQEELRSLYGKRVGVVGKVSPSPKRPNLEVVSIREISGGCPTLPSLPS